MNLKNIDIVLIFFVIYFLVSCSKIPLYNKEDISVTSVIIDEFDNEHIIKESNFIQDYEFYDFYNRNNNFQWQEEKDLIKQYDLF